MSVSNVIENQKFQLISGIGITLLGGALMTAQLSSLSIGVSAVGLAILFDALYGASDQPQEGANQLSQKISYRKPDLSTQTEESSEESLEEELMDLQAFFIKPSKKQSVSTSFFENVEKKLHRGCSSWRACQIIVESYVNATSAYKTEEEPPIEMKKPAAIIPSPSFSFHLLGLSPRLCPFRRALRL